MSGPAHGRRRHADEFEYWPRARWSRLQLGRLKRLLVAAHRDLPFYRRRFDAVGFQPARVRGWEDVLAVPIFGKAEILAAMEHGPSHAVGMEFPGEAARVLTATSGTLGTTFLSLSPGWRAGGGKALGRAYRWAGFTPGMRLMSAAPAWHSLAVKESYAVPRLRATCVVPWGTFVPRFSRDFLDALLDLAPEGVSLFLPMVYALLAECARRGLDPAKAFSSVRSLLVVGAPMTPRSRQALQRQLRVQDLFEGLGNSEGLVAMECDAHSAHHVFVDVCHVEIVDPVTRVPLSPGRRGSVVMTYLNPHGSAYIRYDTQDLGEVFTEPCECGRSWPRLKVYDRWANSFTIDGKTLVPYDVRLCLEELPELVGVPFAVIRRDASMSVLRLAIQQPPVGATTVLGARVRAAVKQRLGIATRDEWVEELPARWKGMSVIAESDWGAPGG